MSACIKRNSSLLKLLLNANNRQRQALLRTLTSDQIRAISECCLNSLSKDILHLTPRQERTLKKKKKLLHLLAKKNVSSRKKKQILIQHGGGFLDALLTPVLTHLANFLI